MPKKKKRSKLDNLKGNKKQFPGATPPVITPQQMKERVTSPAEVQREMQVAVKEPTLPMDLAKIPKDQIPYVAFYLAKSIKIAAYKGQSIKSWTYHIGGRIDEENEETDPLA